MIKYEYIIEAQDFIVKHWKEDGKKVIETCLHSTPYNNTCDVFISKECDPCGGNWSGMLLSGVLKCYPEVYEVIPHWMGKFSWECLCYTLLLLGVDTTASS